MSNMKLPHWAMVLVSLVGVVVAWVMQENAKGDIVLPAVVLGVLPLVQAVLGMLSPSVSPGANAKAAGKVVAVLGLLALAGSQSGCLSSAPIVPVTPANQAQIASCSTDAQLHNAFVLGDIIVGGTTTGIAGASAAFTDTNTKTALAISAAIAAGLTAIGTGGVGLTTMNFEDSKCADVVGSLPIAANKAAAQ